MISRFGWRAGAFVALLAVVCGLELAINGPWKRRRTAPVLPVRFVDAAARAGLDYRWTVSGRRPLNVLQTIGNGCAFLDYNNDGNLDILLVGDRMALYQGDSRGHFLDVTHQTGLDRISGHFLGCAVGDYDNDGWDDIYLSGYRTAALLHNEQGKGFTDVTRKAGLAPQPWGTSCAFGDLDGDGFLDLYVANYLDFGPQTRPQLCLVPGTVAYIQSHGTDRVPIACSPEHYRGLKGVLYHNLGGQFFQDITSSSGAAAHSGKGLGVAFAPFDDSGRPGLAVANDVMPGNLFLNRGGRRMEEIGRRSGTAFHQDGTMHSGMGVDWGDFNNDGRLDLFVATFDHEPKDLYVNQGGDVFADVSRDDSFGRSAWSCVTFGCKWLDADNDGWLDLLLANGHIADDINGAEPSLSYREPTLLLYNHGGRGLEDATRAAGMSHLPPIVGRGLATGDYDNDGRVDALVVDSEGHPLLLHNESPAKNHWLGLRLIGTGRSNRDAYGALVTAQVGKEKRVYLCHADGSYLSSSDPRVHIGLGSAASVSLTVRWPDGRSQTAASLAADRYLAWTEGQAPR